MAAQQNPAFKVDRYVVIHVATTCDEHGVYVTKDSAEVIELGWILLDANTLEEVGQADPLKILARPSFLTGSCVFSAASPRERARQARQHAYHASLQ